MHDGRINSLLNVMNHYRQAVINGPTTDSLLRKGIPLSNFEIGQLTAFIYTLTDSSFLKDARFAPPGYENRIPQAPQQDIHNLK